MMRIIGRGICLVLLLLLIALTATIGLLQTRWGVQQASQIINAHSSTSVSFTGIAFHWDTPGQITLSHFTVSPPGQPPFLTTDSADIQWSLSQLINPGNFAGITLRDGRLDLGRARTTNALQADTLQLVNMAVTAPAFSAGAVNATFSPWQPQPDFPFGHQASWQVRMGTLSIAGQTADSVTAQGMMTPQGVDVTALQANAWGGTLHGALRRLANGQWHIRDLQLDNIRLQTTATVSDWLHQALQQNEMVVDNASVNNARLEGGDWAATDLNLTLRGVSVQGGNWHSQDGLLAISAGDAVIGNDHLLHPEIRARLTDTGVVITQAGSEWQKGVIKTRGQWLRSSGALTLDHLSVDNLEYTLPGAWKAVINRPLPAWLTSITVREWQASRNLIIDIDPSFPWQITALSGEAHNLQLAKQGRWGIWQGDGAFTAQAATFNRTDILRPALGFEADANRLAITKLNGLVDNGQLGATATVSQDPARTASLTLRGEGIAANALANWGWPTVTMAGPVNMALQATASLAAGQPLRPGVDATLSLTGNQGTQQQVMRKGVLVP